MSDKIVNFKDWNIRKIRIFQNLIYAREVFLGTLNFFPFDMKWREIIFQPNQTSLNGREFAFQLLEHF